MKQTGNSNKGRAAQPPAYTQPPINTNSAGTTPASTPWWTKAHPLEWALLPLRLFLGVTFVYAGIQKLTDPQFFNPRAIGYIGKQIIGFASGSPIHNFLISLVLPHAHFFGIAIILGEVAIGLGTLFGFLLRPAAFFGMLLSLMFFLSASWHVYPYFYGADIVFVFAWLTMLLVGPLHSALPSLDGLLIPRYLSTLSPESQVKVGRISQALLGVGNQGVIDYTGQTAPFPVQGGMPRTSVYNSRVNGSPQGAPNQVVNNQGERYPQSMPSRPLQQRQSSYKAQMAAQQRSLENRRKFLLGLTTGGLGMLVIAIAGRVLHIPPFASDDSAPFVQPGTNTGGGDGTQSTPGTGTGSGTPTGSGSSNAIAQVNAVPANSAVTFTIPSNGDPGVLVHLSNGKFVCFDATCTHAGCPVSFDSGSSLLICPCHGAEFDPANNAGVVTGPTNTPLTSVPININSSTGAITLQ